MLINIILLAIGLFALVKASDVFVDSASSFATSMRAPKTLIALTIAAFGTCAPELAISFNSIATHNYDMTLANVIGSCVVNILLIVGIATIVNPIKVKNKIIKNELPLLVITSAAFCIALNDSLFGNYKNGLSRLEAGAFVFLFGVFMLYIVLAYIKNRPKTRGRPPKAKYTPLRSTIYIIITIIVRSLFWQDPTSGWPSLVCIISMVSGVQLLCLGILGQYMSKTYLEVKHRPIYLVKEEI